MIDCGKMAAPQPNSRDTGNRNSGNVPKNNGGIPSAMHIALAIAAPSATRQAATEDPPSELELAGSAE
jgi:hypothetical protein